MNTERVRHTVRGSAAGSLVVAALLTVTACGQGKDVTFAPAGDATLGAQSSSRSDTGASVGSSAGGASAGAGVSAGDGIGASATAGIGGLGVGAGAGISPGSTSGHVSLSGAVTWGGTVTGTCLRSGAVRRVHARLGNGSDLSINIVGPNVGHIDLTSGTDTWSANWVGDTGIVSLNDGSLAVNDAPVRNGSGTVHLTASFGC